MTTTKIESERVRLGGRATKRNARLRVLGVLGCIALLTCALLSLRTAATPALTPPPPPNVSEQAGPGRWVTHSEVSAPVLPSTRGPSPLAVIDGISIEKSRVCEGEENLVTVRAHIPGHPKERPRVRIGQHAGDSVPLRVWLDADGRAPVTEVRVSSLDGREVTRTVPYFVVERCPAQPLVHIERHAVANSASAHRLVARVVHPRDEAAPRAFDIRNYAWDFGDGRPVNEGQEVVHDFEEELGRSEFSTVLVTVDVTLSDGRHLVGRTAIELVNPFLHFAKQGFVLMMSNYTPRLPEVSPDGRVKQRIRLRHYEAEDVRITRVVATTHYATDGAPLERSEGVAPSPEDEVSPDFIGADRIPPGRGVEFDVTLDPELEPDVAFRSYEVEGTTDSGRPARGTFSIMRPPPPPNAANSIPIEDPRIMARIQRASELLGKDFVSLTELARLEREGKFASLSAP